MMRERTLGNSVTQLYKKLMEQHSEAWTRRFLQYLTACEPFTRSSLVRPPVFAGPPLLPALPKPKWLLAVYARDVLGRLHEVKAKITSVLGCVLKMDSTKKVFFSALFISRNLPDTDMCVHNECPYIFHNRSQRNLLVLRQEQLPGAQMWGTNAAKSSSPWWQPQRDMDWTPWQPAWWNATGRQERQPRKWCTWTEIAARSTASLGWRSCFRSGTSLKCASTSGTSCAGLLQVSTQRLIRSTGSSWHVCPRASFCGIQRMWLLFAVQRRLSWRRRRLATSQKGRSELALPGGSWRCTAGGGPGGWKRPPNPSDHWSIGLTVRTERTLWEFLCWTTSGSSRYGRNSGSTFSVFKTRRTFRSTWRRGRWRKAAWSCAATGVPVALPPWSHSTSTWTVSFQVLHTYGLLIVTLINAVQMYCFLTSNSGCNENSFSRNYIITCNRHLMCSTCLEHICDV